MSFGNKVELQLYYSQAAKWNLWNKDILQNMNTITGPKLIFPVQIASRNEGY
jgi:hypothetical protein